MMRSIDVAFGSGASVVSLIPTRTGNGAIDALEVHEFAPPRLPSEVLTQGSNAYLVTAGSWSISGIWSDLPPAATAWPRVAIACRP
jgi:hypothetical protein